MAIALSILKAVIVLVLAILAVVLVLKFLHGTVRFVAIVIVAALACYFFGLSDLSIVWTSLKEFIGIA